MKYIVGLGNPGRRYARSRHNFGWMVLDDIAEMKGVTGWTKKWNGRRARTNKLLLFKPQTFMNRSGNAVREMIDDTGADAEDLLVLMDDLDLNFGTVRLRPSGSAGGHRGLQSIIDALGTREIPRLRLGIGPCAPDVPPREFVLQDFDEDESLVLTRVVRHAAEAALSWEEEGIELAMSRYNGQMEFGEED